MTYLQSAEEKNRKRRAWYAGSELAQQRQKEKTIRRRNELQAWIESLKTECVDCGETDPDMLEWHHLDPSIKEVEISNIAKHKGWSRARTQEELDKCVILCANHHKKRHAVARRAAVAQLDRASLS